MKCAIAGGADLIYLHHSLCREALELCRESGVKLIAHTGRITEDRELSAALEGVDGVMAGNLGSLKFLAERSSLPLYLDFSINVFNSYAADFLKTEFPRIASITLSPELTLQEIKAIAQSSNCRFECIVHGFLPLMISEHCIAASVLSDSGREKCSAPCKRDRYSIQDEAGYVFPLYFDSSCRTHILNSRELSMLEHLPALIEAGISSLRIETLNISSDRVKQIVSIYRRNLDSYLKNPACYEFDPEDKKALGKTAGLTYGHYFRGVE